MGTVAPSRHTDRDWAIEPGPHSRPSNLAGGYVILELSKQELR